MLERLAEDMNREHAQRTQAQTDLLLAEIRKLQVTMRTDAANSKFVGFTEIDHRYAHSLCDDVLIILLCSCACCPAWCLHPVN